MSVKVKRIVFLGLLLSFTVLFVIFSGIIELNTMFLLALASFGVGIAVRECGIKLGAGFYIASVVLSFILAPNKIYCITFAIISMYPALIEFSWEKLATWQNQNRTKIYLMIKLIIFNIIYISILFFFPKLIYQGEIKRGFLFVLILIGQPAFMVYDKAYSYFQGYVWERIRKHIFTFRKN